MGKNTEYTLTKPKSPASKGRTYAIYCAVGVDVRETALTNEQAHKLLDAANNGQSWAVRQAVAELDSAVVKRKSVAKELQGDSKPKGYKDPYKGNGKAKTANKPASEDADKMAVLLTLCDGDEVKAMIMFDLLTVETEKPKPKAKAKAKPKAKPAPVKDEGGNGSANLKDILNNIMEEENANVAPL